MKKILTFGIAVTVGFTLLQSAEAGSRGGGRSFGGAHFSGGSRGYSGGARYSGGAHYSTGAYSRGPYGGGARYTAASGARYTAASGPRYTSMNGARYTSGTRLRNPTYNTNGRRWAGNQSGAYTGNRAGDLAAANRTTAYNSLGRTRNGANLTNGVRSRQFNPNGRNVVARQNANWRPNWNRNHDHNWNGHRCHFYNGFWYIYDPFPWYAYPYGYDYYPYETYYDPGYDTGSYPDDGTYQDNKDHQYSQDQHVDGSRVSEVQRALAHAGYYDGAIDGVLGPGTRRALRNYQHDHGLDVTGGINQPLIEALRLR